MRDFEDYCWRDVVSDNERHIYSAYVRERAVGKRPALLVVHPGTAAARKTEELLNRRISDLAERHPELAARIS